MTSRCRKVNAERHAFPPALGVLLVLGPSELLAERIRNVVEVERGVKIVPAENFEDRQIVLLGVLGEVRKADPALLAFTVVGDEEQIFGGPRLALGLVGGDSLLEGHLAQDAA